MIRRIDAHHHLRDVANCRPPILPSAPVTRFLGRQRRVAQTLSDRGISSRCACSRRGRLGPCRGGIRAARERGGSDADAGRRARLSPGVPHAVDLATPDAAARITADAAFANGRGIRITAEWPADPARDRPARTLFANARWRSGYAALGAAGGVADMMAWPDELGDVEGLARAFPDVPLVIEHFGLFDDAAAGDPGMAALAACANVAVKLSGPGLVRRDWSTETVRPLIQRLRDLFGSGRLMIGSNAPVDLVMADYVTIVARFDAAIADLPAQAQAALWHETAARLYRIAGARA